MTENYLYMLFIDDTVKILKFVKVFQDFSFRDIGRTECKLFQAGYKKQISQILPQK